MTNRAILLFVSALLLVSTLGYWLLGSPPTQTALPARGNGHTVLPLNPPATVPSVLVAPPHSPQANSDKAGDAKELVLRFNRSQSYRAFIFDAIKHPELGGLQFAQAVLALHAIQSESSQSAGVNTHTAYFDGTWYPSVGNTNTLYLAYDLVTCNLGLDCGASSYKALSLCASRGFCGDSVANAIRNGVAQREGLQWEQIEGLARSLSAAIQQGNAQAFVPPQPAKKP